MPDFDCTRHDPLTRRGFAMLSVAALFGAGLGAKALQPAAAREAEPGDDHGGNGNDDPPGDDHGNDDRPGDDHRHRRRRRRRGRHN